jgi:glycine/D-amino acid oxidase-like deaminating enzyme
MTTVRLDLLIIGGGAAGLWTLNRAIKAGYSVLLIEKGALGGGQSVHSQGIIHGGTKYALNGTFTRAASAIAAMPDRWRSCLAGQGELDLSAVTQLSDATYFWSQSTLGAKMTSFLASKALRGRVDSIAGPDRPDIFRDSRFGGALYRLAEPVLDVPSVIAALADPVSEHIVQLDAANLPVSTGTDGRLQLSVPSLDGLILQPQRIVIAAGDGFPALVERMGLARPTMQRRPLHMVVAQHGSGLKLFGHCIGASSVPLVSITTHPAGNGRQVWYMGGGLAETGVAREPAAQIAAARATIAELLPWVDLGDVSFDTLRIDRAEPATDMRARPDTGYAEAVGDVIVAWPTKLTLAPDLADTILRLLPPPRADATGLDALAALPRPPVARPFWETM